MKTVPAIVVSALSLLAIPAAAQTPALWSVSDADTTIYLFGSVHAFDDGPTWLSGDIRAVYDASGEVVLETLVADPAKAGAIAEKAGGSGVPLRSSLPSPEGDQLTAALVKAGARPAALDPFKPWYANMLMSIVALSGSSLNRGLGVEAVLQDRAIHDGKALIGLETVEEQFAIFDTIPAAAQARQLGATVADPAALRATTEQTAKCWRIGDLECVAAASEREYGALPEVRDALLVKRNARWAGWIADRLKRPGSVMVAVGIDHLVGDGNLREQLAARGITATRIGAGSIERNNSLAAAPAER